MLKLFSQKILKFCFQKPSPETIIRIPGQSEKLTQLANRSSHNYCFGKKNWAPLPLQAFQCIAMNGGNFWCQVPFETVRKGDLVQEKPFQLFGGAYILMNAVHCSSKTGNLNQQRLFGKGPTSPDISSSWRLRPGIIYIHSSTKMIYLPSTEGPH